MSKEKLYGEILLWTGTTILISSLLRLLSSYTTSIYKNKSSKYHIIEVCLSDIESVKNAIAGGVNSIELCVDRQAGGITPSYGLIKEACRLVMSTDIKINILIRPRDGNFVYSDDEFDVILRDIIIARDAGAHGVVIGILRPDNTIDAVRMAVVRSISHPMDLTFHRAFDVCSTPLHQALDQVISLGCDRLLTSGRASTATDPSGTQCLYEIMTYLKQKKNDKYSSNHLSHLQVVAASGINVSNVRELILSTGVNGVHAGSGVVLPVTQKFDSRCIDSGFEGEGRGHVDEDLVADLVEIAEDSWDEIEKNSC